MDVASGKDLESILGKFVNAEILFFPWFAIGRKHSRAIGWLSVLVLANSKCLACHRILSDILTTVFGNTDEFFDLVKTGAIVMINLCRLYKLKSKLFQPKVCLIQLFLKICVEAHLAYCEPEFINSSMRRRPK